MSFGSGVNGLNVTYFYEATGYIHATVNDSLHQSRTQMATLKGKGCSGDNFATVACIGWKLSSWLFYNHLTALEIVNLTSCVTTVQYIPWIMHMVCSLPCFCYGLAITDFIHILQGYFTGTGAILWLPQCLWSNPEGYGYTAPISLLKPTIWPWQNKTKHNHVSTAVCHHNNCSIDW